MTDSFADADSIPFSARPHFAAMESGLPDFRHAGVGIVQRLGREIVDGTFPPDSRLPDEATMLRRYGISRTALREAYGRLSAKGMLMARPKIGTSVRPPVYWNMLDPEVLMWHLETTPVDQIALSLYPLRRMIEPGAAALAAQVCTDGELAEIAAAYADMGAAGRDSARLIAADMRFHIAILAATHNRFIGGFRALIHATMQSTLHLGWRGAEAASARSARLLQHGDVLEAIRSRNADLARTRMEILIDHSIKDVAAAMQLSGVSQTSPAA